MMVTRIVLASSIFAGCFFSLTHAQAQTVQRVQPIVLESQPQCCTSPAATASQMVPLPCGDCTYLPPAERDPLRVVPTSAQLQPLSRNQPRRGYTTPVSTTAVSYAQPVRTVSSTCVTPGVACESVATPLPPSTASVCVLRPPTACVPPAPTVPEGYVVGRGLVGQPKLYKPGQPVRNFLRFITL
jgi:hypothetical protein